MAEPASGLTIAWLLDHAWTGLVLIIGFLWRHISRVKDDTDRKLEARAEVIQQHETRMSLHEQRLAAMEQRQHEDRETQGVALRELKDELHEVNKEMRLIRKDFAAGFREVSDRVQDYLRGRTDK